MMLTDDQQPVEELPAQGTGDPVADGVRPRRLRWASENPDAVRRDHGVEGTGELACSIPDQELHRSRELAGPSGRCGLPVQVHGTPGLPGPPRGGSAATTRTCRAYAGDEVKAALPGLGRQFQRGPITLTARGTATDDTPAFAGTAATTCPRAGPVTPTRLPAASPASSNPQPRPVTADFERPCVSEMRPPAGTARCFAVLRVAVPPAQPPT